MDRDGRGPLLVAWNGRDQYEGEGAAPVPAGWDWPSGAASAVDAFGAAHPVAVRDGRLTLSLTDTPVFVEPAADAVGRHPVATPRAPDRLR